MTQFKVIMGVLAIAGLMMFSSVAIAQEKKEDHEVGPHKGVVCEWGDEEYHLEVVTDAKAGTVTVYVYGNHKEFHKAIAKPIDSKMLVLALKTTPAVTLKLEAKPIKDDGEGKCSVFVGKHDILAKEMKFAGTISGKVGTKPYSGDFKQ